MAVEHPVVDRKSEAHLEQWFRVVWKSGTSNNYCNANDIGQLWALHAWYH